MRKMSPLELKVWLHDHAGVNRNPTRARPRCASLVLILSLVVVACIAGALPARAAALNVFAAASLSEALREIATNYTKTSSDTLRFNLAASSTLARQIKEGAPADVFFSADEAKMDVLEKAGLIVPETRRTLLSNTLVIIVSAEGGVAIARPADLARPEVRRLALAETHTVPAGIYAREYLQKTGLWEKVSNRIVATENVRAALAAVGSGNADAGIVYQTDALISNQVRIAFAVPVEEGPAIAYTLAVVRSSKNRGAARSFVRYLAGPEAAAVFARFGFLPAPAPASAR